MTDQSALVTPRLRVGGQRALGGATVRSIEAYPANRGDDATTAVPEWQGRLTYSFNDGTWDWVDIVDSYLDPVTDPDGLTVDTCLRAIETIAQSLLDEAVERGWCDEYRGFVDAVNSQLPPGVPQLKHMNKEYAVSFTVMMPEHLALRDLEHHIDRWLNEHQMDSCSGFDVQLSY